MCSTLWFPSVTNTSIYISFIFLLFVFYLKIRCCFCSYRNFLQMYLRKYIHLSEQTEKFNMHLFPPQSLYTLGSPHFFLGIQMMFRRGCWVKVTCCAWTCSSATHSHMWVTVWSLSVLFGFEVLLLWFGGKRGILYIHLFLWHIALKSSRAPLAAALFSLFSFPPSAGSFLSSWLPTRSSCSLRDLFQTL